MTKWPVVPLGDLVDVLDSRRVPVSAKERATRPGTVPYYGAAGQVGHIDRAIFDEPLILLGEDGVQFFDPSKSKAYLIDGPAWVNNHAHVLRARPPVDRRFLMHFLNIADYRGFANGTTRLKLTQAAMKQIPVPLAPIAEQRRVVDLLEDYLSRLDAGNDGLDLVRRRIDILVQLALDRTPAGDPYPLERAAEIQGGIQKQPRRTPCVNAFPFLRVANVKAGGLDLTDVRSIELFDGELDRLRLVTGDLLVVEGNGSASQIGRAALWDGSIQDCVHQNHLIRVRPRPHVVPEYLEALWNSPTHRRALAEVASSSSGLYTLSVSKLKRLSVLVPSIEEQRRRVAELAEIRDARCRLEAAVVAARARHDSLRRSLLAAAFSGRLTGAASDLERVEELVTPDSGSSTAISGASRVAAARAPTTAQPQVLS